MFITDGKTKVEINLHEWDGEQWGEDVAPYALQFDEFEDGAAVVEDVAYTVDMFADARDGLVDPSGNPIDGEPDGRERMLCVNGVGFGMGEPVESIPMSYEVCYSEQLGQAEVTVNHTHAFAIDKDDDAAEIAECIARYSGGLGYEDQQTVGRAILDAVPVEVTAEELHEAIHAEEVARRIVEIEQESTRYDD